MLKLLLTILRSTWLMGIKEKYDIRYIDYGFPGRWEPAAPAGDGMAGDQRCR